jgi:hypothetical protein
MDSSVLAKDKIWFLCVRHHVSNTLYNSVSGMNHFSLYCLPQEKAGDLEQFLNVGSTGQRARYAEASVSYHRVEGMCLSVEHILKEEMLTLCLREGTI